MRRLSKRANDRERSKEKGRALEQEPQSKSDLEGSAVEEM
jgi:hypothetical protein